MSSDNTARYVSQSNTVRRPAGTQVVSKFVFFFPWGLLNSGYPEIFSCWSDLLELLVQGPLEVMQTITLRSPSPEHNFCTTTMFSECRNWAGAAPSWRWRFQRMGSHKKHWRVVRSLWWVPNLLSVHLFHVNPSYILLQQKGNDPLIGEVCLLWLCQAWNAFVAAWTRTAIVGGGPVFAAFSLPFWFVGLR